MAIEVHYAELRLSMHPSLHLMKTPSHDKIEIPNLFASGMKVTMDVHGIYTKGVILCLPDGTYISSVKSVPRSKHELLGVPLHNFYQ